MPAEIIELIVSAAFLPHAAVKLSTLCCCSVWDRHVGFNVPKSALISCCNGLAGSILSTL